MNRETRMLTREEVERYDRQIRIWGEEGQSKIKSTTVLVVGVGGLGSVASLLLTATGFGRLILVDDGLVELSNLQRQVLYTVNDIGKPKVEVAVKRLRELNPHVEIEAINQSFDEDLARELIKKTNIVIDCLDNWETRLIVDRVAYRYGKPFIHAGVEGFYGQLTVIQSGRTPCLRCIFPTHTRRTGVIPVSPPTPVILGSLEVNEAIKIVTGIGEPLYNKLLIYDGRFNVFEVVELKIKNECLEVCG